MNECKSKNVLISSMSQDWVGIDLDGTVLGQNGSGQNCTDKMVWTKWYTDKMSLDKMVWTKWYTDKMSLDKMVWTKWYTNKMSLDKMVRTKWYGLNGSKFWN